MLKIAHVFALLLKIAHVIERQRAICSGHSRFSFKKSDVSDSFVIRANCSKNKQSVWKKSIIFMFLTVFLPFYAQEPIAPVDLHSVALF